MAATASARALGIPELLEHILVQYAAMEGPQYIEFTKPVTALFAWQRVCWTFHDVITSSRALRQAMFLEYADAEEEEDIKARWPKSNGHYHSVAELNAAPVRWLLSTCGPDTYSAGRCHVATYRERRGSMLDFRSQTRPWHWRMKYALASWRKMKTLRCLGLDYAKLVVRLVDARHNLDTGCYEVEAKVKPRGTLGELYGILVESPERSFLEKRLLAYCRDHKLRSECGGQHFLMRYTLAQERAVFKYFDDIQKHVGGSMKGEQAGQRAGKKGRGKKTTKERK